MLTILTLVICSAAFACGRNILQGPVMDVRATEMSDLPVESSPQLSGRSIEINHIPAVRQFGFGGPGIGTGFGGSHSQSTSNSFGISSGFNTGFGTGLGGFPGAGIGFGGNFGGGGGFGASSHSSSSSSVGGFQGTGGFFG